MNRKVLVFSCILIFMSFTMAVVSIAQVGDATYYIEEMKKIKDRNGGQFGTRDNDGGLEKVYEYEEVISILEAKTAQGISQEEAQNLVKKYYSFTDSEFNNLLVMWASSLTGNSGGENTIQGDMSKIQEYEFEQNFGPIEQYDDNSDGEVSAAEFWSDGTSFSDDSIEEDGFGGSTTSVLIFSLIAGLGVFLTQNINGALAGLSSEGSGSNGNNNEDDTKENKFDDKVERDSNLILESDIEDSQIIAGDSEKAAILFARVYDQPDELGNIDVGAAKNAMRNIDVYPQGKAKEYIYIEKEKEQYWDGWRRFYIYFTYSKDSKFYKGDRGLSFPLRIPLAVYAEGLTNPIDKIEYITIEKPEPKLIIEPRSIIMAHDSIKHRPIDIRVSTFEEGNWEFVAEIEDSLEIGINDIRLRNVGDKESRLFIKSEKLESGIGSGITNNVIIKAKNLKTGSIAAGMITVSVVNEGLSVVSERPLHIYADSDTETELKITAATVIHGKTVTDYTLLENIVFDDEIKANTKLSLNAIETAGLQFEKVGWENISRFGEEKISAYIYKVKTKNVVPGNGESYHGYLNIQSTKGEKTYFVTIPIVLDTASIPPKSKVWKEELDRCRKVAYLLPKAHQQRILDLVNSKAANLLGYEGLYELRHRIWRIGEILWEAEGLSGYEDVEKWSGYIENTLKWTQWMGRMAADLAGTLLTGGNPFMGIITGEIHDVILSSLVAYRNGESLEEWFNGHFVGDIKDILEEIGAEALDPERMTKILSKVLGKNVRTKAIAYLMLFTYYYVINIERYEMSVLQAIREAAKRLVYVEVLKFVAGKVMARAGKRVGKNMAKIDVDDIAKIKKVKVEIDNIPKSRKVTSDFTDPMTNQKGYIKAKDKISKVEDAIRKGDKDKIQRAILDVKTDKYAIAEINKKVKGKNLYTSDLKKAINDEYDDIVKKPVNEKLNNKIENFMENKKGVKKVLSIEDTGKSNPSAEVKVGSDWDVGKKVKYIDKHGNYKVEIMKQKDLKPLLTESVDETLRDRFGKELSPEDIRQKVDIEAMGNDAAGGFSKDVDKAIGIKSNMEKYIDESVNIKDPEAFGKTSKYKIQEWWNERANHLKKSGADPIEINEAKLEGLKQYHKQHNTLLNPMSQIAKVKKPGLKQPPKILKDFHELSGRVIRGETSIEYMENVLNKKGYSANKLFDMFGDYIEVYAKEL